jgi:spore maturation protein CgeB
VKIIYVGPLVHGGTCHQRLRAIEYLGHQVYPVDTCPPEVAAREMYFQERVWRRLLGPRDLAGANLRILEAVRQTQPQVLWVDKGLTIGPETLKMARAMAPRLVRVSYSPDDMMNPRNQSRHYVASVPVYDLHVTTKSYNVAELSEVGAPRVLFVDNAYCPFTHRPLTLTPDEQERFGGPVGFVGTFEPERARTLLFLAEKGIAVRVWGSWPESWRHRHPNLRVMGMPLYGDDYARTINSFDVNLAFLRKNNRDLQTTRSLEIPACGGFMLAERTAEHQRLFAEGLEADYFSSREELLEKIRYHLMNPGRRQAMAAAGRQRCLEAGYSNVDRLKSVLEQVLEMFNL